MNSDAQKLQSLLQNSVNDESFRRAVFSKPVRRDENLPSRIDVRPVLIQGVRRLQLTSRVGNQELHRNCEVTEGCSEMCGLVGTMFLDIRLQTSTEEWIARHSRKGTCRLNQTASPALSKTTEPETLEHNRSREYLISDGTPCPFLIETGIMSKSGRVVGKHFSKFRQINRYLEFISDIVDRLPSEGTIRIVDFGCGKSYLTFATHYLFSEILKRDVSIVGLDQRADVISTCHAIADKLQLSNLVFRQQSIATFQPEHPVHLAISLHACDTATDDALANAVKWNSDVIFAVPCCQHELAATLSKNRMPIFSQHGILHEKFSSLATDGLRSALLSQVGYDAQVMEFIDMEHTAKNLLIRAIRRKDPLSSLDFESQHRQIQTFCEQLGVSSLRLQQKLEEFGLLNSKIQ